MTAIILGFMAIAMLYGAYTIAQAFFRVLREQFEEMMPERMVDLTGFVEMPKQH